MQTNKKYRLWTRILRNIKAQALRNERKRYRLSHIILHRDGSIEIDWNSSRGRELIDREFCKIKQPLEK